MHWNIRHDTDRNYVHAYQSGQFSIEDQASFLNAIITSAFWQPGTPLIIDYCALEVGDINNGKIEAARRLMVVLDDRLGDGRLALLCDGDEEFGVGRQFESMVAPHINKEVSVFRDEAAAIDWVTESGKAQTTS